MYGQDVLSAACQDGETGQERLADVLRPALLAHFRPAFLGRLVVVPYRPLGEAQIGAIVKLKLDKIRRRFERNHHAALVYAPPLARMIAQRCTEGDSGARNIDNILSQSLLPELAAHVLERMAQLRPFRSARIDVDAHGAFAYRFDDEVAS